MSRLRIFLFRLRGMFLKRNLEQELADEIRSHLEMQIEDYQRQGMSPDEARYAALRKFGGVEQVKETYRERRGLPYVETFLRDLGYGVRMLRRSSIITTVAILSLALGIGANTALFSVVDAVLLKTLPVDAPFPRKRSGLENGSIPSTWFLSKSIGHRTRTPNFRDRTRKNCFI